MRDQGRRHPGAVRGHDRGPRAAAPSRQGHRLGDRRVLDAAAGHGRTHRPRIGEGPDRRPNPRDPAADRSFAARRVDLARLGERTITVDCDVLQADGGTRTASITGGYVALAAATRSRTAWSACSSARWRPSRSASSTAPRYLDLDYSEDSRAEVDFNVVGTDAGDVRRAAGHGRGQALRSGGANELLDLADAGLARLFEAQTEVLATVRR